MVFFPLPLPRISGNGLFSFLAKQSTLLLPLLLSGWQWVFFDPYLCDSIRTRYMR